MQGSLPETNFGLSHPCKKVLRSTKSVNDNLLLLLSPKIFTMPWSVRKENLPVKTCRVCEKPFTWRKKWEKNWSEVKYCSDRCRMKRKEMTRDET